MSLVLWATTLGSVVGPNLSLVGDEVGRALGLPPLVGPFLFSAAAFAATTLLAALLLRTPPAGALEADAGDADADPGDSAETVGTIAALRAATRIPSALFGIAAVVVSQTVMVGVMVMTPVTLHDHGADLGVIGLVISIHVFGMYAASPVMGWLADRIGGARLVAVGIVVLLAATGIGIVFPSDDMIAIPLALGLLGLGWSAGLIGGSSLLTVSLPRRVRVPLQGATDAAMNLAAAASAALSGIVLGLGGFAAVNAVALGILLVLIAIGARTRAIHRKVPTSAE